MPLVGQICWVLDYPFLKRYSRAYLRRHPERKGEDLMTLKKNLERSIGYPASLINLAEGTRFTLEKAKRRQSPYRYLLNPKKGGFKIIIQALGSHLKEIIDVTIVYDQLNLNFWEFISGKCKRVVVKVRRIPINRILNDPELEGTENGGDPFTLWLQDLWKDKDEKIGGIRDALDKKKRPRN